MIAIIKATNDVIVCIHKKRLCFLLSIFSAPYLVFTFCSCFAIQSTLTLNSSANFDA